MAEEYADLMTKVTRAAPWILGDGKTFLMEDSHEDVQQVLGAISGFNLVIISERGKLFQQHLAVWIKDDRLLIGMPFGWNKAESSFDVFFRRKGVWNFFRISGAEADRTKMYCKIPKSIGALQRRLFPRLSLAIGAKAVFKDQKNLIGFAFLHDISEAGMWICVDGGMPRYRINANIHDISISIPPPKQVDFDAEMVLPYISKGKIVRINQDTLLSISHYGISFIHEEAMRYRKFNLLMSALKNQAAATVRV